MNNGILSSIDRQCGVGITYVQNMLVQSMILDNCIRIVPVQQHLAYKFRCWHMVLYNMGC